MNVIGLERNGLIRAADVRAAGEDPRALRDAARRGHLVRVRRGAYCTPRTWAALDRRRRHLLHIRAVLADDRSSSIVAGRSAGAVWNLPDQAAWPDPVRLLVPRRSGGSSEADVRRSFLAVERAERAVVEGVPCTSLERTACDLARTADFATGVMVLDAARSRLRDVPASLSRLRVELESSRDERGARKLERALDFSTDKAESPGESLTRVVIHRLGFVEAELQREFVDEQGSMFPDFFWPEVGVALEFDGEMKYTREQYTGGDPARVVWDEKRREDRLRRQVDRVERITYAEVVRADPLARRLGDAGVPRRAGPAR